MIYNENEILQYIDENDVKFPAFTVATFALSEYNPYCKQSHPL